MTSVANAEQFDAWNGDGGRRWVAAADQRDRILAPVADALLDAAALTPGERVLDVGCGCGVTTLTAAVQVGDRGSVTGIDLSAPMLAVARERALSTRLGNVEFVQDDAQTRAFEPASVDLVLSRFGTMFFSEPAQAFGNIGAALTASGRLCIATWRPLVANEWLAVPGAVLLGHTDLPPSAEGPGMFAQSDASIVADVLGAAGFVGIDSESVDVTLTLGRTVDEALTYLAETGPGRTILEGIPEGRPREAALDEVRNVLSDHVVDAGVQLGGAIWLITAAR